MVDPEDWKLFLSNHALPFMKEVLWYQQGLERSMVAWDAVLDEVEPNIEAGQLGCQLVEAWQRPKVQ